MVDWHPGPGAHALRAKVLAHSYLLALDEAIILVIRRLISKSKPATNGTSTARSGDGDSIGGGDGDLLEIVRVFHEVLKRKETASAKRLVSEVKPLHKKLSWGGPPKKKEYLSGYGSVKVDGDGGNATHQAAKQYLVPRCALTMEPNVGAGSLVSLVDTEMTDAKGIVDGRPWSLITDGSASAIRFKHRHAPHLGGAHPPLTRFKPWQVVAPPWSLGVVSCDEKAGYVNQAGDECAK